MHKYALLILSAHTLTSLAMENNAQSWMDITTRKEQHIENISVKIDSTSYAVLNEVTKKKISAYGIEGCIAACAFGKIGTGEHEGKLGCILSNQSSQNWKLLIEALKSNTQKLNINKPNIVIAIPGDWNKDTTNIVPQHPAVTELQKNFSQSPTTILPYDSTSSKSLLCAELDDKNNTVKITSDSLEIRF